MAYQLHIFFCTNQRSGGKQCCADAGASEMRDYMKKRVAALAEFDKEQVRVNTAGCLGRCAEGPLMVIYPEGVWYTYQSKADIDEIIESHIRQGRPVERLLLK